MKLVEKMANDAVCGWYNEMDAAHWWTEGFHAARNLLTQEIKNIAAQTDDLKLLSLCNYLEKIGEEEV